MLSKDLWDGSINDQDVAGYSLCCSACKLEVSVFQIIIYLLHAILQEYEEKKCLLQPEEAQLWL